MCTQTGEGWGRVISKSFELFVKAGRVHVMTHCRGQRTLCEKKWLFLSLFNQRSSQLTLSSKNQTPQPNSAGKLPCFLQLSHTWSFRRRPSPVGRRERQLRQQQVMTHSSYFLVFLAWRIKQSSAGVLPFPKHSFPLWFYPKCVCAAKKNGLKR